MTKAPSPSNPVLALAEQLRGLSVAELTVRYEQEWGRPPRIRHAAWLRKQIARRIHERECGGLSKLALARLQELIGEIRVLDDPAPPRSRTSRTARSDQPPRVYGGLPIGTVLERTWRGSLVRVTVTAEGFELDGTTHRSLSAVANSVTGQHVSGNRWFGIKSKRRPT